MLQLTVDPTFLSRAQRESIAAFVLNYPSQAADDEQPAEIPAFTPEDLEAADDEQPAAIPAFTPEDLEAADAAALFGAHLIPEAVDEDEAPVSDLEAAAIFGVTVAPGPVLVPNPPAENDRLDKSGLPWDERIHASSRAKNADSTWRKKRGIDEATVALVEAELKALMMLPGAPAPAAVAAIPAPPISASVVEDRQSYVTLLSVASAAINAKTLTNEQLSAAVVAVGVPSLPLLANRLDLVPQVMAAVKAIIG